MQRSTLPTIAVRDGRAPIDTTNPHALTYAVASIRGARAKYARIDRRTEAALRELLRDEHTRDMRITLARSVGDPWGALGTRAIDGVPGDERLFGPFAAACDDAGRTVDSFYRSLVLGAADHRIREAARAALFAGSDLDDVSRMLAEAATAGRAARVQAAHATHGRPVAGAIQ